MSNYEIIQKCKICGSAALTDVFSFPPQHLSATFVEDNARSEVSAIKVPLTLTLCDPAQDGQACGHLQLREEVNPDLLYREYFYRSSTSTTMQNDLRDVVEDIQANVDLSDGDIVVDIGANDFTMLGFYPDGLRRTGFEPARNINWDHVDPSITKINDYFSAEPFNEAFPGQKAKAVSCCAMFYDLSDPNAFVRQVKEILSPDGIWCMQLSYLPLMLDNLNFYDICHEHLSYYSLQSLERLMDQNGLMVVNASTNAVNGGSIRAFVTHKENTGAGTSEGIANLDHLRAVEDRMNLTDIATYKKFHADIESLAAKVRGHMDKRIKDGEKVFGLGASTKGNVLIQLFGITKDLMPIISERNPEKFGLRTLGTDIELISEQQARELKPKTMLVLPWYFKNEIVKREDAFIKAGGELLFPMPYAHIVSAEGEIQL